MIATPLTSFSQLPAEGPLFVYGTGLGGRMIGRAIRLTTDLPLAGYVDSFRSGTLNGSRIYDLREFRGLVSGDTTLIIASTHFDEILEGVRDLGLGACFDGRAMFDRFKNFDESFDDGLFAELFWSTGRDIAGFHRVPKGREKTRPPTPDEITQLMRELGPTVRRLVARHVEIADLGSVLTKALAAIDQEFRNPHLRTGFAGPLNGQSLRAALMRRLDAEFGFDALIETGAFRGTTTEFLAEQGRPVFSCESNEELFYSALVRLARHDNVALRLQDSRTFLEEFCATRTQHFHRPFFYLDAHWGPDLPLFQEIDTIAEHFGTFIIIADDFKNPFHSYGFDSYGPEAELTMECMLPRLRNRDKLCFLFPNYPSEFESGGKSGHIVIAPAGLQARIVEATALLRPFEG